MQNYEFRITYKNEYLFRIKEITSHHKYKNTDKQHRLHKIQNNNIALF